jgi:hypothetical protein
MNKKLIDSLDECIKIMEAGVPLDDCLAQFPEQAVELRQLLKTAEELTNLRVENIPDALVNKSRTKFLLQAMSLKLANNDTEDVSHNALIKPFRQIFQYFQSLRPIAGKAILALGIAGLLVLFSGGLLFASAKSLPGDSLYPVKLVVEDIRVSLAHDNEARHKYEASYSLQRVEEVKSLIGMERTQQVSFKGTVISTGDVRWNVSGIPVIIQSDTKIIGGIGGLKVVEPGMTVEVEGVTRSQGWVMADEIHLQEYQFIGSVEKIGSNYWLISGIKLFIPSLAQIDPGIEVGDDALVFVHSEDSGLYALKIIRIAPTPATPTEYESTLTTLKPSDDFLSENTEEYLLHGILNKIDVNYWVVNGDVVFIVHNTQIEDGINIGNVVSVKYIINPIGSMIAIEIGKEDNMEKPGSDDSNDSPEFTTIPEDRETSTYKTTETQEPEESLEMPEQKETMDLTETPEPIETPEPTENHLNPN